MKPRLQERGQALILIALAAVGLFGFSALAIDGSRIFSDRRHAQNAADTAALAAALARVRAVGVNLDANGNPIWSAIDAATVAAGLDRATSNGYTNDADSTVEVHMCNETGLNPPCEALPSGVTPSEYKEYIQVKIVSTIPTTFARVIGRAQVTSVLTAIAHAGPGLPKPFLDGVALAALKPDGDNTLGGNGVVHLDVNNSGVFNNSTGSCATQINGASGSYTVDTSFQFANNGQYCSGAGGNQLNPVVPANPIPYPPATLVLQAPTITCSGTGSRTFDTATQTFTYHPGNYPSGDSLTDSRNINFSPGNYCFGGDLKLSGTSHIIANDVNFLITGGEFTTNGSTELACNNMLVHIKGGSGMRFNGNSTVYCNNVTFFASTGSIEWSGNSGIRLFAPKGGEYENVLIYMPFENTSQLNIVGNSANELTGSIIAVHSDIKISGNSGTTGLHSQIIGYTVDLAGSSNTVINYSPGEQVVFPDPSDIQLTK